MYTAFAQTAPAWPLERAVILGVAFGVVGLFSLVGLFAPGRVLASMSGLIGSSNPLVARIACGFGVLIGGFTVVAAVMSQLESR